DENTGEILIDTFRAAWEAFQQMDVASFAETLTGSLDAIDYAASVAGDALGDTARRMELFLGVARRFAPEFAEEFERILSAQGSEAANAWLRQQAILFAEGGAAALGAWAEGLTPAEIRRIIEEGIER